VTERKICRDPRWIYLTLIKYGPALIRERRLPRRQGQAISFDEHAVVFGLRLGKKADKHEGSAKHQPY